MNLLQNIVMSIYDKITYLLSVLPLVIILNIVLVFFFKKRNDKNITIKDITIKEIAMSVLITYVVYTTWLILF